MNYYYDYPDSSVKGIPKNGTQLWSMLPNPYPSHNSVYQGSHMVVETIIEEFEVWNPYIKFLLNMINIRVIPKWLFKEPQKNPYLKNI